MRQLAGHSAFASALGNPAHAYHQWTVGELNFDMVHFHQGDVVGFWLYEVTDDRMRRFWLRGAIEVMQAHLSVADGTPADAQLATYFQEAEVVVSADKVFIAQASRCRTEAPFATASALLVPGGVDSVEALFAFLGAGP